MNPEAKPTYDVFISYSSRDKRFADAACAVLEAHRIRCWIAPREITPGTEWGASIIGGIDSCRVMVLIFSAHANESSQVRREVERAISKGLPLLPVRVEDTHPEGAMEYALSNTHWLNAFTPPVEAHLEILATSVQALLEKGHTVAAVAHAGTHSKRALPPRKASKVPTGVVLFLCLAGVVITFFVILHISNPVNDRPSNAANSRQDGAENEQQQGRLEKEVVQATRLHTFAGDDKGLQESRIQMAMTIAAIAEKGIDAEDAESIWTVGNNQHNNSLRFKERPDLAPLHVEEADALHAYLEKKILQAPKNEGKAKALQYLGIHHDNMVSMIELGAGRGGK